MPEPLPAEDFPASDGEVGPFVRSLGLPGILDVHVHVLPERLQRAVWAYFDRLEDPPWPVTYRQDEARRLQTLRELGVVAHTALAYAHRPGVAAWCNDHTLDVADRYDQVLPTFTFYPEDGVDDYVDGALARGARVAKVHLQVGRFHATDPRLTEVWRRLEDEDVPTVIHASAVYGVEGGHEYCGPDAVRELLERHPRLRLIVAHLGMPDFAGFLDLAQQAPELRFDTSAALLDGYFGHDLEPMVPQLRQLAEDRRLLFGSDFPTIPQPYAEQVSALSRLGLTPRVLADVLHGTAAGMVARPGAR